MELRDKVVVVTGAGRGAGRCIALALAEEGARLALASRTRSELDAVRDEVKALGGEVVAVPTDLSDPEQVEGLARETLKAFGIVDVIINNADRKSGHVLIDEDHHLWLIDHGVSFHEEYKLRTVVWDFVGEAIPDDLLHSINNLVVELSPGSELHNRLSSCLVESEIIAIQSRSSDILENPVFPPPGPGRPYPWPLV